MRHILLFGAGRSASTLIKYLLDQSQSQQWFLTVCDSDELIVKQKTGNHVNSKAVALDIQNELERHDLIQNSDIVISMLPPFLHTLVASDCVRLKKNLCTASYVSTEIAALEKDTKDAGILIMNECGLDPGIDHMSAMDFIDKIKSGEKNLISFKSYTGGLVAPESNDNPWGYKFTWNPRNVILAGQGTARFIQNNQYKYIPYNRLFTEIETIEVDGLGSFDGYANRDSLSYRHHYGLENIPTMLRGTLRQQGYCAAWDIFVRLGLTDDTFKVEHSESLTYAQLLDAFIPASVKGKSKKDRLAKFYGVELNDERIEKIWWTGIGDDTIIGLKDASPAQILQQLLEPKWKLKDVEKDMIVMQHIFEVEDFKTKNITKHTSTLVVKGDDTIHTAMSKTVGLPLGITAKNILNGKINLKGIQIPVFKQVYQPVLNELKTFGIEFNEVES